MGKVTSKYQVTVPKDVAERYRIRPGDLIEWIAAGDVIHVLPSPGKPVPNPDMRIRLFDEATRRIARRASTRRGRVPGSRGWTRGDLYSRGRAD